MVHYFDSADSQACDSMYRHLDTLLKKHVLPGQPVIVMCIGSDRSTGDCLGPLIGYKLSKFSFENVHIYGCLQTPIHAANLSSSIEYINKHHPSAFIIALDASLGKKEHIGYITIGTGPLKPGLGVKKKLPEVGNIHITGIVNTSGLVDHVLLQTTRLATIMTLADVITAALVSTFLTNVPPDIQQVPVQQFPHRRIS